MKYSLDNSGRISSIGIFDKYEFDENTPFYIINFENWRKDLITNEWIYDPIIMVPQEISKLQAVSRLLEIGRYNDLIIALDSDETGIKRILFDAASDLYRNSNMVNEIAVVLGFSNDDIDNFFTEASKIMV